MRSIHSWTFEIKPGRFEEFRSMCDEIWPLIQEASGQSMEIYRNQLTVSWLSGERQVIEGELVTVVTTYKDVTADEVFQKVGDSFDLGGWEERLFRDSEAPARSVYFGVLENPISW